MHDLVEAIDSAGSGELSLDQLARPWSMWKYSKDVNSMLPDDQKLDLIPENSPFNNLMSHQKLALCRAMGYAFAPTARDWASSTEIQRFAPQYETDAVVESNENFSSTPLAFHGLARAEPTSQIQIIPCGAGKTAIITLFAALSSRNSLIITNTKDNAIQLVRSIVENTNLVSFVPIRLLRSNAATDGTRELLKDLEAKLKCGLVVSHAPSSSHVLDGAVGIVVVDVNTVHFLAGSSADRCALRELLFRSNWGSVVIDEADAVLAAQAREAFRCGAVAARLPRERGVDGDEPLNLRFKLKYDHLFALSGTFHRGDREGYEFLNSLGPSTFSISSKELEASGYLAKMVVSVIKCDEPVEWRQRLSKRCNFAAMTPEKLRVCSKLVEFHASFGHKIMIFTLLHWHVRLLEWLFPSAVAPTGATSVSAYEDILQRFKRPVSSNHPLVWITTSRGEVGLDVPDCCVVINLVNNGESPNRLRQRMGRASRKALKFGWFYDLVGADEVPWADKLVGPARVEPLGSVSERYRLVDSDGYDGVRMTSKELDGKLDSYIKQISTDSDEGALVVEALEKLGASNVFEDDAVVFNHILTCLWGSLYSNEEHRCNATLFDTRTAIALKDGKALKQRDREASRLVKESFAKRRRMDSWLPKNQRTSVKKLSTKPSSSTPSSAPAATCMSLQEYLAIPVCPLIEQSERARAEVAHVFSEAGRGDAPTTTTSALWAAMMASRHEAVSNMQHRDDERVSARADVTQLGEIVQEFCRFLHDE